ncbi:MAG TPA: neuraminidase-like domain-containing protein, partial [Blastocatellia bacterium]
YPTVPLPDGGTRPKNALDMLFERRSDIGEIQLSCQNTNSLLPYIDLVNEILENAVVRQWPVYQTTWTAEELSANPEHQNESAYAVLARQVYSRLLPFNLWLQEARTYLGHLGASTVELMEVLQRPGRTGAALALLEWRIAVESLGLSPFAARIITDPSRLDRQPWEFWGVDAAGWPGSLADLPTFLRQAEIEYEALEELRKTEFINASGRLTVNFATPCNIEGATINSLTEASLETEALLDRIHRFLRLQQAVKWEISELDAAMTAMQAADLTVEFLVQCSQIQRLKSELNRPLPEMLSWWSAISTVVDETDPEDRSLYNELFLNNATLNPPDEAFQLNSARSDLQNAGTAPLGEHKPAILAALAVTEADLELILTDIGKTESDGLTLDMLSELHRHASFAKALGLSVSEMLSVRKLTGIDPFSRPKAALDFSAEVETIGQSGFGIETLDYLLRDVYTEASGLAPAESSVILTLDGIKAGLEAIAAENLFTSDPTGEITREQLALLLTESDLGEAVAIIEGTSTSSQADQEAFIDLHFGTFFGDTTDAKALLTQPLDPENQEEERQARYEYVLRPLVAYLKTTLSAQLVVQTIADSLGLEMAVADSLLTKYLTAPDDESRKAIDVILGIDLNATTYTETGLALYRLLSKVATVLTTLKATAGEMDWVFGEKPAQRPLSVRLDLKRLLPSAVATDAEAARHYVGWKRLIALYGFRDRYPAAGDLTVFSVLDLVDSGGDRESALETLGSLTGWDPDDLDYLTGADGFDLAYPADYLDERYLAHLQATFDLLARLGVAADEANGWKVSDNLEQMKTVATAIKSAAKAKYDNETWLGVAEPLKNQLRELQRGALVAHLIARQPGIEDTSDLFERYLIDVEMNACMKTSRIKQAISSVQLFVQRSLMNLEPEVEIAAPYAEQWDWMKNYRVWEANRKIFLYPENWIVPELRDDKSPFFEELENELLQDEINQETAERVFVNYLDKLDKVANLDVRALYHEKEDGETPIDVLHVFARTHSTPYEYYYRRRVDSVYWTPWEKVEIDVQGDHLLALAWNRRIYLFWFVFTEVSLGSEICGSLPDLLVAAFPELTEDPAIHLSEEFLQWFEDDDVQQRLEDILEADDVDLDTDLDEIITEIEETLGFVLQHFDVDLSSVEQIVKD